jgi:hypothetical protein
MKPLAALLALALLAPLSAHAQPTPIWGGHYNMGVFAAGGGSETDGHISLECAGDELADAGAFFLQLEPAAAIEPFTDAPPQLDFLVDGEIFTLPVTAENGAVFFYRSEPGDDSLTASLIEKLRRGHTLTVAAPELDIARISLRGSSAALIHVQRCVVENN